MTIGQNITGFVTYIDIVQNSLIDCGTPGWTLHFLMHTLGFLHEHQRYDRDSYIYINSANLETSLYSDYTRTRKYLH